MLKRGVLSPFPFDQSELPSFFVQFCVEPGFGWDRPRSFEFHRGHLIEDCGQF